MDNADRASSVRYKLGHQRADPLVGINVEEEYKKIESGTCRLDIRIQGMITRRYLTGA